MIGIGFWPEAVGGGGRIAILRSFAAAERALATARGTATAWDHLAFGSDYDGAVAVPFDASGMPGLTWALMQGAPDVPPVLAAALARIAGANVCRVLAANLPSAATPPDARTRARICAPLLEARPR